MSLETWPCRNSFAPDPVSASFPRSERSTRPQASLRTRWASADSSITGMAQRIGASRLPKPRFRHTITSVMPVAEKLSPGVQDYAKAIYALAGPDCAAVTNNALAEKMGVTAASASGMVRKLCELGLVTHVPYKGVVLTEH